MKQLFFTFFIFVSFTLVSQEKIWLNNKGNITSKENATYFRPIPKKVKKGYWIIDYYVNGQIAKEGFGKSYTPLKEEYEGLVVEYYKNGKKKHKFNYREGLLHGIKRSYYESGELKQLARYRNGLLDGVWKEFNKSGKIKTKGKYNDGEKVGVWKTYYKNEYKGLVD